MKLTLRVIALILLLSALVSAFAACDYISFPEDINGTHENGGSNSAGGDESTNTGSGNNDTNSGNNNDGGNGTVEGYGSNVSGQYGNIGTKLCHCLGIGVYQAIIPLRFLFFKNGIAV